MKVAATPTWVGVANRCMSQTDNGEPISAPPPKPMMAMPVAMPGRSGNQVIGRHRESTRSKPTPDHPVAEIDEPELVQVDAERRDEETAAKAKCRGDHGLARPDAVEPSAGEGGGEAKKNNGDRENPAKLGQLPVAGSRLGDADQLGHRQVEHAEGVNLADPEMNAKRAGGTSQRLKPGLATVCSRSSQLPLPA